MGSLRWISWTTVYHVPESDKNKTVCGKAIGYGDKRWATDPPMRQCCRSCWVMIENEGPRDVLVLKQVSALNGNLRTLTIEARIEALNRIEFCDVCGHDHDEDDGCVDPSECIEDCCSDV